MMLTGATHQWHHQSSLPPH